MITMKCCNNSEHIRFENLLKEGCEYKSKKKKLISDFQINTCKINEIQLGFVVRRFQRQTLSNVWPNIDFPSEEGLDAKQHGDHIQQNQLNINALGDYHKSGSLLMTAVSSTIILPLPPNQPFDQITSTNKTKLAASSNTTDGTAKTLLKLIEVITRNHGHFAPVSQWMWTPPPQSISAGGYGPPSQVWTPLPNFPFEHRLYRIW